jgi:hypothetical protein
MASLSILAGKPSSIPSVSFSHLTPSISPHFLALLPRQLTHSPLFALQESNNPDRECVVEPTSGDKEVAQVEAAFTEWQMAVMEAGCIG